MPDLDTNVLYYGDNLDILRRHLPESCVDLVDLDPPAGPSGAQPGVQTDSPRAQEQQGDGPPQH